MCAIIIRVHSICWFNVGFFIEIKRKNRVASCALAAPAPAAVVTVATVATTKTITENRKQVLKPFRYTYYSCFALDKCN